jgi:hypothetical protein
MAEDTIKGRVLEDGTVRWETPDLHGVNHASADGLLGRIRRTLGGESRVVGRGEGAGHSHIHHHQEQKR